MFHLKSFWRDLKKFKTCKLGNHVKEYWKKFRNQLLHVQHWEIWAWLWDIHRFSLVNNPWCTKVPEFLIQTAAKSLGSCQLLTQTEAISMESWFKKTAVQPSHSFQPKSSKLRDDRTCAKCRSLIFIFLGSTSFWSKIFEGLQPPLREMMPRCANIMNKYWRKQQRAHVFKYCIGFIQIAFSRVFLHAWWIEMSVRLGYKTRPIFEAKSHESPWFTHLQNKFFMIRNPA